MIETLRFLIPDKKEKLYLAVSMGTDSLCGTHWLIKKGYKNLCLLHFNHKIRSQNNLMEKKFIEFCSTYKLPFIIGKGNNLKTEVECRRARLEFYQSINSEDKKIITFHHLDDWVETYLLNCFRGNPNHNSIPIQSDFSNYKILHPFLVTKKGCLKQYGIRNNLERFIIEDETNKKIKGSRRNWIRNIILKEMHKQKLCLHKYAKKQIQKQIKLYY